MLQLSDIPRSDELLVDIEPRYLMAKSDSQLMQ